MPRRKQIRGRCGGGGSVRLSGMPSASLIHVDARDLVSGSNYDPGTSRVSSWPCRNGSITFGQSTASRQPLYQATGFGSSPGVLFDGSDDILFNTFSGMSNRPYSIVVGLRYTGGASNYHQAAIGGSANGSAEGNSDNYYNGLGLQPTSPAGPADGFVCYQGPGFNRRDSQVAGSASTVLSLACSWAYEGGTNVCFMSRMGESASITSTLNDIDVSQTMQSMSIGQYNANTLEGQITEARIWTKALSQNEINRATRVMNGRLA